MKTTTFRAPPNSGKTSSRARINKVLARKINLRRVLVPVDFSRASVAAIDYAIKLAGRFGAEVNVVHVMEPVSPLVGIRGMPLYIPEAETEDRIRRHLRGVARSHGIPLRPEHIHAIKGQPFAEICRLARKIGIDLIVIPTHGHTGLTRLALGSTAERVVRYAHCPVLVLRQTKAKAGRNGKLVFPRLPFRKIVVPVDFSDCSLKGLSYAKELAKAFDARLVILHSVHLQYYVTSDEYARYDFPMVMEQTERFAERQLRDLMEKTDWEGIKVESALEIGHAGEQVCDRAKDRKADLIVTSTHGRTGLKHVFIGSTAEYVVRHAPCPVLVVPSHERTFPR